MRTPAVAKTLATAARFGSLLRTLQSELQDGLNTLLSHTTTKVLPGDKVGEFKLEADLNGSRDVVLGRKGGEEEVGVSAVLGPLEEGIEKGNVFVKVGVRKVGVEEVVLFDCEVFGKGERSDFVVRRAACLLPDGGCSVRQFPLRSNRSVLQRAFKEYLVARGLDAEVTDYLLFHLREKEEKQYVNWLQTYLRILEGMK